MPYATKMQFRIGSEAGFVKRGRGRQKLLKVWRGEDVTYWDMHRLVAAGLVERVDGHHRITDIGRWVAVAYALDMPMTEMYIMADMYVTYCTWRERGVTGTFPIELIRDKLDSFLKPKTIYNQTYNLCRIGMIKRVSHGLYTITRAGVDCLSRYHKDVHAMHAYMYQRL